MLLQEMNVLSDTFWIYAQDKLSCLIPESLPQGSTRGVQSRAARL